MFNYNETPMSTINDPNKKYTSEPFPEQQQETPGSEQQKRRKPTMERNLTKAAASLQVVGR
jgi:hypothetical protein